LLSDPAILLLDEPTNGLDPRGMSEVRDIIKSLKGKERLIFMSSHILSEVAEVCDEVAMIDHGKLVIYDTIANVTAHVSGGESIVEVGFKMPIEADLVSRIGKINGVTSVEKKEESKIQIRFKDGVDAQEAVLAELVRMNVGVISYRPATSALEDVYLNLIKETV
jgi:ABC-2 type transport system ATP-binding protein